MQEPQRWRLTNDYLHLLGRDTVARLGYDYDELQRILDAERPRQWSLIRTYPLQWWLHPRTGQFACASLLARVQTEGVAALVKTSSTRIARWIDPCRD